MNRQLESRRLMERRRILIPRMKVRFLPALLLSSISLIAAPTEAFLDALAETESRRNPDAIGRTGDRGEFQFTEIAWRHASELRKRQGLRTSGFVSGSHDRTLAREHARTLIAHLEERLRSKGVPVTISSVWFAWTMGETGASRINFNAALAPAHKRRGLERLRLALKGSEAFK